MSDALIILISNNIPISAIEGFENMPPFAVSTIVILLYETTRPLIDEQDELSTALWDTLPVIHSKPPNISLQARHAVILLSRSPNFPSLLDARYSSVANATYTKLLPLLRDAGMTDIDLSSPEKKLGLSDSRLFSRKSPASLPWNRNKVETRVYETKSKQSELSLKHKLWVSYSYFCTLCEGTCWFHLSKNCK